MSTEAEMEAALDRIINELIVPAGERMSRFVLAVETMDLDTGERGVIVENADGMVQWDVTGLLDRAIDVVKAEEYEEDDD